jgi:hypothetical protein
MTKKELSLALEIAKSDKDFSNVDDSILEGLYLKYFKPVTTTLDVVAKTIRWNTFQLNGGIDSEELNLFAYHAKTKIQII